MTAIAESVLFQINSSNYSGDVFTIYKPQPGCSGFITTLRLTVDIKSIDAADFPYIPDDTPANVLQEILNEVALNTPFKEVVLFYKKGNGAWVRRAPIQIFNKEPYYDINLIRYFSDANTIDISEDLSLGIQLKVGNVLAPADTILVWGTAVEEKKNDPTLEAFGDRISALETLLGTFGAPSTSLPGSNGLVPAPPAGGGEFLLRGDRAWENPNKFASVTTTDAITQNVATKAPIANAELTGTPKAPTATTGTNTTQIANTAFVAAAINTLIGNATPESLNTLQELAAAFGNDPNYAAAITTALGTKVAKSGNETIGGNKTFTEAVRIQGLFPGIWLDETDHTVKGAYLVIDGGVLQVQRRSAQFGAFEATLFQLNIVNGVFNLLLPSSPTGLASGSLYRSGNTVMIV